MGPVLFLIFINDIDSGLLSWILKFADDTKIFGPVTNPQDCQKIQCDLDNLVKWSDEWQMKFNVDKCKVMHIGSRNHQHRYTMNGKILDEVEKEKDLGVVISRDLKASNQCTQAYLKASKMLGMLNRTISYKSQDIMVKLYKSIVRPHLEYCSPAWAPHYQKDKDLLERIQHRFTRMFGHLRKLEYNKRLQQLGLWSLEERRNRADLIEVYKMATGLSTVPLQRFFEISPVSHTRGHSVKLRKHHSSCDARHYFFSERVVTRWNSLSQEAVSAPSLNSFKNHLNKLRHTKMGFFMDTFVR